MIIIVDEREISRLGKQLKEYPTDGKIQHFSLVKAAFVDRATGDGKPLWSGVMALRGRKAAGMISLETSLLPRQWPALGETLRKASSWRRCLHCGISQTCLPRAFARCTWGVPCPHRDQVTARFGDENGQRGRRRQHWRWAPSILSWWVCPFAAPNIHQSDASFLRVIAVATGPCSRAFQESKDISQCAAYRYIAPACKADKVHHGILPSSASQCGGVHRRGTRRKEIHACCQSQRVRAPVCHHGVQDHPTKAV